MKFVRLHKDPKSGFGLVITCGSTYDTVLHGAFVESVHPKSSAHLNGNIGPGDQIMSVNGTDVQNDHYLTVVDLLQYSSESVDLVISKASKSPPNVSCLIKEITEIPFTKSKAWVVGNSNTTLTENNNSNLNMPIPKPRKKWLDQEKPLNVPDLTLNHASHPNLHKMQKEETDSCSLTQGNIPDIIASQMKQIIANGSDGTTESLDENFLLPGEVFHVVLDKKRGSLGLNIYQGTESAGTEQRHIYIHSVIPNGAADLDGRIKPGDKLLEVNGAVLVNLSYQEVVTKLRESPQVAHLVLEKGTLVETHELIPKNNHSDNQSDLPKTDSIKRKHSTSSAKFSEYITQQETQRSSEGFKDCDSTDQMSYSSLPTTTNQTDSSCFDSAKDTPLLSELSLTDSDSNGDLSLQDVSCSKKDSSSLLTYAKAQNSRYNVSACRYNGLLLSYSSTPNLAETSDEEEKAEINRLLYRNKSTECLNTPHFMAPHQALEDFYHNYSFVRGPSTTLPRFPVLPIRKRKLKKLDDVYNYCNSDTTFEVCIRKSSRGLGISIFGGSDTVGCDTFSQLIRIRKLYPLQPALECGKLALGDVILEVNGCKMVGLTNTQALEVLRCADTDVALKVFRPSKSLIPSVSTYKGVVYPFFSDSSSSACSSLSHTEANTYNVETGEFDLTLVKRNGSLGFTISKVESSREGIKDGIYVKALIREPAVSDGRIHPGDRILEVNGMDISPLTHVEAIAFLRNSPHSVTLKLYRSDPPLTPGCIENYLVTKPLRWEAVEFLNDHQKSKDSSDESSGTSKKKLNRKFQRASNAPSLASSTESESNSSNSSSGQEHIVEDAETSECSQEGLESSDLGLDGMGLQRNQRPKSLEMLNSSDRKRCPDFQQQESFHRQSSVICPKNGEAAEKEKNLMKWRGSTLPHSGEMTDGVGGALVEDVESASDEDRPVPFPRSTSCAKDWVHTFDVDLDRGWHGRLGFSLFDPLPTSPNSPRDLLPKAAEVKAVFPNSLAEKDGRIKVGDRLVEVNRESFLGRSAPDVIDTLRKTRGLLRMVFCRLESRT